MVEFMAGLFVTLQIPYSECPLIVESEGKNSILLNCTYRADLRLGPTNVVLEDIEDIWEWISN